VLNLRPLLTALIDQGYVITVTASNRYMVRNKKGDYVTVISPTAKDWRALSNNLAALRRDGFHWRGR
jgi:hypothetical protein